MSDFPDHDAASAAALDYVVAVMDDLPADLRMMPFTAAADRAGSDIQAFAVSKAAGFSSIRDGALALEITEFTKARMSALWLEVFDGLAALTIQVATGIARLAEEMTPRDVLTRAIESYRLIDLGS